MGARFAILAILGGLFGCKPAADAPEVGVVTLHPQATTTIYEFPGRVVASFTAEAGPGERIDGSSATSGALVNAAHSSALATAKTLDLIFVGVNLSRTNLSNLRQAIDAGRVKMSGSNVAVKLRLENGAISPLAGALELSDADIAPITGAITVQAVVPNPKRLLQPGMPVRAIVEESVTQSSFLVPQRAVTVSKQGETTAMFLGSDGKVEARVLSVARGFGDAVVVVAGIRDGDRVIVQGAQHVRAGQQATATEVESDETGVMGVEGLRGRLRGTDG
ncbi:hypothetical protein CCR94_02155 [Rhodoblastus sphagnicola]|uniref:RND efflux pump membrane fusion protein barrel-sandwich domain-containing protein n=2 Tax=Rhodoblastus sphagnicola TaxID=333368 RepID=A0A2S6NF82_9HYPH|nr:hypothetical protein CCR94_02155 [Rhodoblastus sphagnicola]